MGRHSGNMRMADHVPSATSQTLGMSVRRGAAWSLLNSAVVRLGSVVSGIVIARLLVPEDYGTFAIALVVLNALLSINELGVSLAIVRWPGNPERIAPTVMTLSVVSSVVLYALTYAAAPTLAGLLGASEAAPLVRVLALSMVVDGVSAVPAAMLTRDFLQNRRLKADLTGFAVSTAITIGLAWLGYGAWSLVIGYLLGNLATSILVWFLAPRRPRPGWNPDVVSELLAFGLPLCGSSLLVFGVLNLANIVVGAELGATELGFYTLAFNLSSWPVSVVSLATRRVAMAAFARIAHDSVALEDGFARAAALLLAVTLPICALLFVLSEPLIRVVYGSQWVPAAQILPWLAVLAAARVLAELAYDLLVAVARSRAVFAIQGLWLFVLIPALFVGAHQGGVEGVALAQAIVAWVVVVPAFYFALSRAAVRPIPSVRYMGRPVLATAAAVAAMLLLDVKVTGDLTRLVVLGMVGAIVSGVLLLPLRRLAYARLRQDGPPSANINHDAAPTSS